MSFSTILNQDFAYVRVTKGMTAYVDIPDHEDVKAFIWYASLHCTGGDVKAIQRNVVRGQGKRGTEMLHRHICGLKFGDALCVDHINHNPLDNRRDNLRACTHQQNTLNRTNYKNTPTRLKGITWNKSRKKWASQLRAHGRQHHLGCFPNPVDAARAYDTKAIELFGEFACTNETLGNYEKHVASLKEETDGRN